MDMKRSFIQFKQLLTDARGEGNTLFPHQTNSDLDLQESVWGDDEGKALGMRLEGT